MIKFFSLDILGVSHRISRKKKNAVYHLQISAFSSTDNLCQFESKWLIEPLNLENGSFLNSDRFDATNLRF